MYIMMLEAAENGGRPAPQTWDFPTLPDGYAWCPQAFYDVFYSTDPAGFVDITVENGTVTAMTVNMDALDAYIASMPEQEAEEPSEEDDTAGMLVDHEYRLTLLELGLSEY